PAPVVGLDQRAAQLLGGLLDLRVNRRDLLFGRVRRDNVDELVRTRCAHCGSFWTLLPRGPTAGPLNGRRQLPEARSQVRRGPPARGPNIKIDRPSLCRRL